MSKGFFIKMAIAIVLGFGLLYAGFYFWKPLNITYYKYRIGSSDIEAHKVAVKYLLDTDAIVPVKEYYTNRYASKDVKERLAVVDELCGFGDKGKKLMCEIFRNRCMREQVLIPAGSFMMGSERGDDDEKPVHSVRLKAFWMDKYEVTNEKYYVFIKCRNYIPPGNWDSENKFIGIELQPVAELPWNDANEYAKWLGMKLPTEAQWEYSCLAGSNGSFCFGDNVSKSDPFIDNEKLNEYSWWGTNSGEKPHNVGTKKPNKWGLYDMHGNVREFCRDWYSKNYYSYSPKFEPQGPSNGSSHVNRGGCFAAISDGYASLGCASIRFEYDESGNFYVGFRVCRSAGQ
jgi:formylglycine-generating enzyme required for sulfatase activity